MLHCKAYLCITIFPHNLHLLITVTQAPLHTCSGLVFMLSYYFETSALVSLQLKDILAFGVQSGHHLTGEAAKRDWKE